VDIGEVRVCLNMHTNLASISILPAIFIKWQFFCVTIISVTQLIRMKVYFRDIFACNPFISPYSRFLCLNSSGC
jgi:hypothetical protein